MTEADTLRELARAFDDLTMWRTFVALLPYTVHVDHRVERAERARRESRERAARLLTRIPAQRLPFETRRLTTPRGHL